jgi:hypothetical protein
MLASVSLMDKAIVSGADAAGSVGFGFIVATMTTGPVSGPGPGRWSVVVEGVTITEGLMGVELAATIAIFCASGIVMSFTVEGATVGGAVGVEPAVATVTFCASGMVESFTAEVRATLSIGIAGALLGVGAILGADRTAREMPSAGQASPIFRFGARAALPFGSEFGSESVIQRSPPSALETRRWPFVKVVKTKEN